MQADSHSLLQKYLHNELTSEEQAAFQKLRREDPDFDQEAEAAAFIAARRRLDAKKRWQGLLAEKEKEVKKPKVIPLRRQMFKWASVAALFVLAGLSWYLFRPASGVENLVEKEIHLRYPSPVVLMGESQEEEPPPDWRAAIKAYQEGQYDLAIALINKLLSEKPGRAEQHFYLGLSYLYASKPDYLQAVANFESSKQLQIAQFGAQADWFIALAFIRLGDKMKAKTILEKIVLQDGWKKESALKILEEL